MNLNKNFVRYSSLIRITFISHLLGIGYYLFYQIIVQLFLYSGKGKFFFKYDICHQNKYSGEYRINITRHSHSSWKKFSTESTFIFSIKFHWFWWKIKLRTVSIVMHFSRESCLLLRFFEKFLDKHMLYLNIRFRDAKEIYSALPFKVRNVKTSINSAPQSSDNHDYWLSSIKTSPERLEAINFFKLKISPLILCCPYVQCQAITA